MAYIYKYSKLYMNMLYIYAIYMYTYVYFSLYMAIYMAIDTLCMYICIHMCQLLLKGIVYI